MLLAIVTFVAGSPNYTHISPTESPISRVFKVVWAAWRAPATLPADSEQPLLGGGGGGPGTLAIGNGSSSGYTSILDGSSSSGANGGPHQGFAPVVALPGASPAACCGWTRRWMCGCRGAPGASLSGRCKR